MHQNPLLRLCLLDPTFLKSINKYIRKTPSKGTREEKKGQKPKQKTTPESTKCTMGSSKRRNQVI